MAGLIKRVMQYFRGDRGQVSALRERLRQAHLEHRGMMSKIDSAQTTDENRKHWANADFFSADAAYNPQVRYTLRNRGRYESLNNGYCKADVRSSADDLIGTGPRLQLTIPNNADGSDNSAGAMIVEGNFREWGDETRVPIRLRICEKARVREGECFGIFDTNERLKNPVKFDVRWLEAEMCTTPFTSPIDPYLVDGMLFDRFGNPIEYYFLKYHPGSVTGIQLKPYEFYTVPAERVIHWFNPDRIGQHRGIPEITPSLPLYSQLRRYTSATLTAAEFAAMIAGIMTSNLPIEDPGGDVVARFDPIEMIRGALLTLPNGYEATQMKAEQPTTTYPMFKREILNEAGRSNGKPLNVITGNSSEYNFSSGRLDGLPYNRGLRITRNDLRLIALDRIFRDGWYPEAVLTCQVPPGLPPIEQWRWTWNYDGMDSIDPVKDSIADDKRIKNGTSTYAEILAEYGQDWCEVFKQIAKEKAYALSLGLPWPILSEAPSGAALNSPLSPDNAQAAVLLALEEAGADESLSSEVMAALEPTFAELQRRVAAKPARNGFHRNGAAA
jgi:lambda family phage portal protein